MTEGAIINFGEFKWKVLNIKDDMALMITEDIVGLRWYHSQFVEITWADSEIKSYLNNEFYHAFKDEEKVKIVPVVNRNPDNPWFKTKGGLDSTDNIFLLSLEEVCKYFGDSSEKLNTKGDQRWAIKDENNSNRQAKLGGEYHWWRLRSPGYYGRTSASISSDGSIYVRGNGVHGSPKNGGGVRPALWLKIST